MKRLASTMSTDFTVQFRNRLYYLGIGGSFLFGLILSQIAFLVDLARGVPVVVLLISGGGGLLYVAGLIIFEKDEGTLSALIVSPLKIYEYLLSKVATLTFLAIVESATIIGVALLIMSRSTSLPAFDVPMLLAGVAATGILYTLLGIILSVRYDSITDMLVPLVTFGMILQLPFLHFLELFQHPLFLVIPTSAPMTLMQGAFRPASTWEWVYGVGYTAVWTAAMAYWAYTSFKTHVVMRMG